MLDQHTIKEEDSIQTGIECLKTNVFHLFLHASEGAIKLFINNGACCLLYTRSIFASFNLLSNTLFLFTFHSPINPSIPQLSLRIQHPL